MKIRYIALCYLDDNFNSSPDLVMGPYKSQKKARQAAKQTGMLFETTLMIKPSKTIVHHVRHVEPLANVEAPHLGEVVIPAQPTKSEVQEALAPITEEYTPTASGDIVEPPVAPPEDGSPIEETLEEYLARTPGLEVPRGAAVLVTRNKLDGRIEKVELVAADNQTPEAAATEEEARKADDEAIAVMTQHLKDDVPWNTITDLVGSVTSDPEKAFDVIFKLAEQIGDSTGNIPEGAMDRILRKVREVAGAPEKEKIFVKEFGNNVQKDEFDLDHMYMIGYEHNTSFYVRGPFTRNEALTRPRPDSAHDIKLYHLTEVQPTTSDFPHPETVDS